MPEYRLYYLDRQDHITAAENFEAANDAEAIVRAEILCRQNPACHGVELWQGTRVVHRYMRP